MAVIIVASLVSELPYSCNRLTAQPSSMAALQRSSRKAAHSPGVIFPMSRSWMPVKKMSRTVWVSGLVPVKSHTLSALARNRL